MFGPIQHSQCRILLADHHSLGAEEKPPVARFPDIFPLLPRSHSGIGRTWQSDRRRGNQVEERVDFGSPTQPEDQISLGFVEFLLFTSQPAQIAYPADSVHE